MLALRRKKAGFSRISKKVWMIMVMMTELYSIKERKTKTSNCIIIKVEVVKMKMSIKCCCCTRLAHL